MLQVKGRYCTAKVFTDELEETAEDQIKLLCDQEFTNECNIRIMPDVHGGKACVIGFTADLGDKVIPNIVGVDIGCGMLTIELGKAPIDFQRLDDIIRQKVPSGMYAHEGRVVRFKELQRLNCFRELKETRWIERSIGTLGGGNHFIEVNEDKKGNYYLVIHSGSRNLGKQVADIYQRLAVDLCSGKGDYFDKRDELIKTYKEAGRRKEIQGELAKLKSRYEDMHPSIPEDLCYLTGKYREQYLQDMDLCQKYATLNRETMANIILKELLNKTLEDFHYFETIHNYINFKDNIIRKGSISAYQGEKILIPINMRDGSLLCIGKGNPDWNNSAPHGAGRLMSRGQAREKLSLEEFQNTMEGVWTTSISIKTLDECPMAYKSMEDIVNNIGETAEIIEVLKPVYNFKAN